MGSNGFRQSDKNAENGQLWYPTHYPQKGENTMKPISKTMKVNLAAALLLASVPPLAQGNGIKLRGG
jgi:hypothetical protein